MNKKDFLKSINNIDDKFLREGEEFFTPVEAEENITLYRKKRSCIKPLISAAACCAVVVAAAVVMVNVKDNLPVNTPDNSEIFHIAQNNGVNVSVSVIGTELKEDGTLNITNSQKITVNLNCTAEESGGSKPVRFFVLKDGAPARFSTEDKSNVSYNDILFAHGSNIEFPISFTVDQNDRCINIIGMIDPLIGEAEETGVFNKCFINSACWKSPSYEMNIDNQHIAIDGYLLDEYGKDEFSECEKIEFEQDDKGCKFTFHFSHGVNQLKYITVFINGEPTPVFGYPGDGQPYYDKIMGLFGYTSDGKSYHDKITRMFGQSDSEGSVEVYIRPIFIKSGDVIQAVISDANAGMFYSSDRNIIK